jgi:phage gp36-like protein
MAYATQTDLTRIGLPSNALLTLDAEQIAAALQNASDRADAYLRARYGNTSVPLAKWDSTITEAVSKIAAYELMNLRGHKPGGPDWELWRSRQQEALEYLGQIQRQQAHPLVTLAGGAQAPQQPNLTSTSVVDLSSGATSPTRGW